jgi:phage terminase large subunit
VVHVVIPYKPRDEFKAFHARKQRWSIGVCHRRAGKTVAHINELIKGALTCKLPNPRFAYIAPFYAQAKDVAWSYLKEFGLVVPGAVANESELRVDFPNGGRVRLYGADNYDRMRGIYLDGVVPDEYADFDPRVWPEVIRPALSDRAGWAAFIGTPKGRNDFCKLYETALERPDEWYAFMLKASETGIVSQAELDDARRMLTPEQYAQEYECSFDAAVMGAYFARELEAIKGQICGVPWDKSAEVIAAMDIGRTDANPIWWAQVVGREIHIIDFYENSNQGADHYAEVLKSKPYKIKKLILPHDGAAHEYQSNKTRQQFYQGHGFDTVVLDRMGDLDGINAARMALNQCWFDKAKCSEGLERLRMFRADYDEKLKTLRQGYVHDWSSHASKAFIYLIAGIDHAKPRLKKQTKTMAGSWMA